jgi:2-succinyl-6-hydroxy-2,4-cyclohexadiene-1-carboxylate synthase
VLHREFDWRGPHRVVLVHGFTQTLRSWDPVAEVLAERVEVVRVDLPGHGGSTSLDLEFADTAAAIGEAGGRATYVGYSMGGRLCLRLALDRPEVVAALVLVGASPGLADDVERAARRQADERQAGEIVSEGTAAFLDRWLAQPLFASFHPAATDLEARLANRPEGLATALLRLGSGAQQPLWSRLGELAMPVLAVAGADDARYCGLAEEMVAAIGDNAEAVALAGAGHAAHLQRPASFCRLLGAFQALHLPTGAAGPAGAAGTPGAGKA